MYSNIIEKLHFIDISTDEFSIFDWKPPGIFKSNVLDLNIVKENTAMDIFFHIYKGNEKIVHIRKELDSLINLRHKIIHGAYFDPMIDKTQIDKYIATVYLAGDQLRNYLEKNRHICLHLEEYLGLI